MRNFELKITHFGGFIGKIKLSSTLNLSLISCVGNLLRPFGKWQHFAFPLFCEHDATAKRQNKFNSCLQLNASDSAGFPVDVVRYTTVLTYLLLQ